MMPILIAAFTWPGAVNVSPEGVSPNRVLVLTNERTVSGAIERDGQRYRIRRDTGVTWVPADNVLFLGRTLDEAYAYLRSRANLRDPDERMRLAQWCHLQGLRQQAIEEASAAVSLRPNNSVAQRLLQACRRSGSTTHSPPAKPVEPADTLSEPEAPLAIPQELTPAQMGQFVSRVQPLLINACASCHDNGAATRFRLYRPVEKGVVSRRLTQQNLQAVLSYVHSARWESSPLLVKAIEPHGPAAEPPLRNRQSPAFRNLEDWVRSVTGNPAGKPDPTLDSPKTESGEIGTPSRPPVSAAPTRVPSNSRPIHLNTMKPAEPHPSADRSQQGQKDS
jgi:hypothetical protein